MNYSISMPNKPIQYSKAFIGTNVTFLVILYQLLTKIAISTYLEELPQLHHLLKCEIRFGGSSGCKLRDDQ